MVGLLALSGCGPSLQDQIIAKNRARPKPGWVRVVNFSDEALQLWIDGRSSTGDVQPDNASGYCGVAPKDHKIVLKNNGNDAYTGNISAKSELGSTIVVLKDAGKLKIVNVEGEPRILPKGSTQLVVFDPSGTFGDAVVKDDRGHSVKVAASGLSEPMDVASMSGKITLDKGGQALAVAEVRDPMAANTAFIVPSKPVRLVVYGNSPKTVPSKGGLQ